jgi:hypothetical protein
MDDLGMYGRVGGEVMAGMYGWCGSGARLDAYG